MHRKSSVLVDLEKARKSAGEALERRGEIKNKVAALDVLDRLAMNPSGWFSERVIDQLTTARRKILVNHWPEATEALDGVRETMIGFIKTLKTGAVEHGDVGEALKRANDELQACADVLGWIDHQPLS